MPAYYGDRVKRMLRLLDEHSLIKDGDRIIELGTGWLHWEALTLRLFYDIQAVLYDVWDNRQMGGLKNYVAQFRPLLATDFDLNPDRIRRAQSVIDAILKCKSFEEIYSFLGFEYVVEPTGSLQRFADASFQLVVSAGVLEHVHRGAVPLLVGETYRILKPGGWAVHSIDTSDHLAHYDTSVCRKLYLQYSEKTWKRFFQNEVQYINRIQPGEWLQMFRAARFDVAEADRRPIDISGLRLDEQYRQMDPKDLACTVLRLTLSKPS
jgi:SAM-dependent methyltransferase